MKFSVIWRTCFAWTAGILLTLVLIPPALVVFIIDPMKQRLIQPMIRFWARSIMRFCFIDIKIIGRENLSRVRSAVFVCNHQSMLDIFMLLGYTGKNAGFLAKKQVVWIPVIGILLLLFGHILVDRSNPRKSLESVQRCIKAINKGWSIFIFPEGTRTKNGEIGPFKSGSMKIPLRTGAPVIPLTLTGIFKVMPKKTFAVNPHPVILHIGEPLVSAGVEVKDFKPFVKQVEQIIHDTKERIDSEYREFLNPA